MSKKTSCNHFYSTEKKLHMTKKGNMMLSLKMVIMNWSIKDILRSRSALRIYISFYLLTEFIGLAFHKESSFGVYGMKEKIDKKVQGNSSSRFVMGLLRGGFSRERMHEFDLSKIHIRN